MKQKISNCSSKIKVCREGKRVIPNLKRTVKKAIKSTNKSYPYK